MSCNKPLLAERGERLPSGKFSWKPIASYSPELRAKYPGSIMIPCGKCAGCRADYSRQWVDRMVLELDHTGTAVFLTLTYDDEHLPLVYQATTGISEMTLCKRDWQLFMKRLRKFFSGREIRFFMCGEYGPRTGRPHYHAILFGLNLGDFSDLQEKGTNELGQKHYISEVLQSVWKNGFCLLADVSTKTCAYVARYVRKKQFGRQDNEFDRRLKEPVFCLSSRRPGIGMHYLDDHPEALDFSRYFLSANGEPVSVYMPDVFLKRLQEIDSEKYLRLKQARMEIAEAATLAKLAQTDLYSDELNFFDERKLSDSGDYLDRMQYI